MNSIIIRLPINIRFHKYQQDGEQGLHDRRGKTLESKQNLTEEEKLQLRIKELEHRN